MKGHAGKRHAGGDLQVLELVAKATEALRRSRETGPATRNPPIGFVVFDDEDESAPELWKGAAHHAQAYDRPGTPQLPVQEKIRRRDVGGWPDNLDADPQFPRRRAIAAMRRARGGARALIRSLSRRAGQHRRHRDGQPSGSARKPRG